MKEIAKRKNAAVSIDIVVPLFNEQEVVPLLVERLNSVFSNDNSTKYNFSSVRYLFIDDGSRDETVALLKQQPFTRNRAKVVRFSRNFGHQAAVSAGVFLAEADITAVIDADLQDPPEMIPEMVKLWREGYDVVYGLRRTRQEGVIKNVCYKAFYRLFSMMSPVQVAVDSGDFCIMGRNVVLALNSLPEKLRFMRGLRSWVGFSQIGYEYDRGRRELGKSKYSFKHLYRLATDGITSLSLVPLKMAQLFAFFFFVFLVGVLLMLQLNLTRRSTEELTLLLSFSNLMSTCAILFCLHIFGGYIGRMYFEVKNRPIYIIREMFDLP